MLDRFLVVLRHNVQMDGDFALAEREFACLMGSVGEQHSSRDEILRFLGEIPAAQTPQLTSSGKFVAMSWRAVSIERALAMVRKSAFAQEIFAQGSEESLSGFTSTIGPAAIRVPQLLGNTAVALGYYYIIESEGVLGSSQATGRIASAIKLLHEPFLWPQSSAASRRLRGAKKTTLSLSHDLHIYKAKFFPRMIRALLNIYSEGHKKFVFDPYCGSGTALLEAALLELPSHGCDVDPISYMISASKVAPFLERDSLFSALNEFNDALTKSARSNPSFSLPMELDAKLKRRDRIDSTEYHEEVLREAGYVAEALAATAEGPCSDLLKVIVSDAMTKKIRYRFVGVGNGRYTIEIIKQPLLDRLREKIDRCRQLVGVFEELVEVLGLNLAPATASLGDARDSASWPLMHGPLLIVTSPPYLPASSGREHYAASRALAFSVLGMKDGLGYDDRRPSKRRHVFAIEAFAEANELMMYLASDADELADPQRDAMRFERKAAPTLDYLADICTFFGECSKVLGSDSKLLLVVAHHHIFYSHRRQELEHTVNGRNLYAELAAARGLSFTEELEMQLLKSRTSRAKPMAKNDYYESVLVMAPTASATKAGAKAGRKKTVKI